MIRERTLLIFLSISLHAISCEENLPPKVSVDFINLTGDMITILDNSGNGMFEKIEINPYVDIKESIKAAFNQKNTHIELLSLYENDIIDREENFYNSIYSGSLFSNKKIITINNGTDKIIKQVKDIVEKIPENVFIIIL